MMDAKGTVLTVDKENELCAACRKWLAERRVINERVR